LEVGIPEKDEDPGKPDKGLSPRGFGTNNRTDPVYLGLQKTRLLDPTLNFRGTNDHPGDYRSSGCSACHVIYANVRDKSHSDFYAAAGNMGQVTSADQTFRKMNPGIHLSISSPARFPPHSVWSVTCTRAQTWWPPTWA
jgi:hypothetical protein